MYVYYVESGAYADNIPDDEGCHEGIKVARATGSFALYYFVDSTSPVEITMYSVQGQQMGLWRKVKEPGKYNQEFNISGYPAGLYLVAIIMRNRYNIYKVLKR